MKHRQKMRKITDMALWKEERKKTFFTVYWDNEQIIQDY